jgi:hypothetical protein
MKPAMDPEEKKVWKEFDERLRMAEKRILATGNLVRAGIPILVDTQTRLDALIDSDARLYGRLEQLAEKLEQLADSQAKLAKKTDEEIAQLIKAQRRTEQNLNTLIGSMKKGGNGHR